MFRQFCRTLPPVIRFTVTLRYFDPPSTETISTTLIQFPWPDFLIIFGLPYLIGLMFLAIGLFVYQVQPTKRASKVFVGLCTAFAIYTGTLFNIYSYHQLTPLWAITTPFLAATLIDLGFVFPAVSSVVRRNPLLRMLLYVIAVALSLYSFIAVYSTSITGYFLPWRLSFSYVGVGIVFFWAFVFKSWFLNPTPLIRQQAVSILTGSLFAFLPVTFWLIFSGWFGNAFSFSLLLYAVVFGPLILFPLSIAQAMLKTKQVAFDNALRRVILHAALILVIVVTFFLIIGALNTFLGVAVSTTSPIALTVYSVVVLVFLEPLRNWLLKIIERFLPQTHNNYAEILQDFTGQLAGMPLDIDEILNLYLSEVQAGNTHGQPVCFLH